MTWLQSILKSQRVPPSPLFLLLLFLPIVTSFETCTLPVRCMSGLGAQYGDKIPPRKNKKRGVSARIFLFSKDVEKLVEAPKTLHYQNNREEKESMTLESSREIAPKMRPYQGVQKDKHQHNERREHKTMQSPSIQERRRLGSMEMFMLPRPIGPCMKLKTTNGETPKGKQRRQSSQYKRPPMNHVAAFILSSTPSTRALRRALDNAVRVHPMLRARVAGDGRPRGWLDPIRRMVRWNGWDGTEEHHPLEFVVHSAEDGDGIGVEGCDDCVAASSPIYWGGSLRMVRVTGSTRQDLDRSWQGSFEHDLDCDTAVAVVEDDADAAENDRRDLWKLELHRLSKYEASNENFDDHDSIPETPCALVLTMNHAISDQGCVNLVMDQIPSDISELEDEPSRTISLESGIGCTGRTDSINHPSLVQPVPPCLEDSLLGGGATMGTSSRETKRRLTILDIIKSPFSSSVKDMVSYASRQLRGDMKLPTLYPSHNPGIIDVLDQAAILFFGSPLGGIQDISHRRSNVEYRTVPEKATSALVKKSKVHRVPISMTLAAAVVATCSDFFGEENAEKSHHGHSRTYKVLQSLDTRRFPGAFDLGDTLSCQAGGMDLLLGPLSDHLGQKMRCYSRIISSDANESTRQKAIGEMNATMIEFWKIATQSYDQTSSFLKGGDAIQSVRMFDLGISLCDIGRLCETFARSKEGRCWSASVTNLGEYERQKSVPRKGMPERGHLMAMHGTYQLEEVFYATSHARVGATFPVGCITVGGKMSITINPPWPLLSKKESEELADAFVELLEVIAEDET